ncbi:hypothetical protein J437_LFUL018570, partial [Ladona fulva]
MDYFSEWVEDYALPNQEAATVAKTLVKEWICCFGVPLELYSDQVWNFESALFQGVCKILDIKKTRITPSHPQLFWTISETEINISSSWLTNRRCTRLKSQSPASIIFGHELRLPCDLTFGCKPAEDLADKNLVRIFSAGFANIHHRVRNNIKTKAVLLQHEGPAQMHYHLYNAPHKCCTLQSTHNSIKTDIFREKKKTTTRMTQLPEDAGTVLMIGC